MEARMTIEELLQAILAELQQMRSEQTSLIRLWMQQDKEYHGKTLKKLDKGVE
jgi:hypothetical protein